MTTVGRMLLGGFAALSSIFVSIQHASAELKVSTSFEGGSAHVEKIDQQTQTIEFYPAGSTQRGWPCWWYLKVEGAEAGKAVHLALRGSPEALPGRNGSKLAPLTPSWAMPARATWSVDGKQWVHTELGVKKENRIVYSVVSSGTEFWIAWGPPFTPKDSQALVDALARKNVGAKAIELCRSREGRPAPALHIVDGDLPLEKRRGIWIHARQHAWESGSSWVCRGLAEWLTSDDPVAKTLRRESEIYIVPIMDIDNTATGNGGKEAIPQDHNRDWATEPHWAEVVAAQKVIGAWGEQKRLGLFIDLHNPGPGDSRSYFYVAPDEVMPKSRRAHELQFLEVCRELLVGPIPYDPKTRTSGPGYHPLWKQISSNWVHTHANDETIATCLETSWNTKASDTTGYQAMGENLGKAIARYYQTKGTKKE